MKNEEQFYLRSRAWKSKAFSARGIRAWMRPKIGTHSVTSWVQRGVHRADLWRPCRVREDEDIVYNVKESVLIICTCSWQYKEYFPLPFTVSLFAVRVWFKRSLRICLALMSNETKESKDKAERETEGERGRQMANKPNNECRLCCLSRERVQWTPDKEQRAALWRGLESLEVCSIPSLYTPLFSASFPPLLNW